MGLIGGVQNWIDDQNRREAEKKSIFGTVALAIGELEKKEVKKLLKELKDRVELLEHYLKDVVK